MMITYCLKGGATLTLRASGGSWVSRAHGPFKADLLILLLQPG